MNTILFIVIQMLLIFALAPAITGVIRKVKALSQKRQGPPIAQMYYDLYKLLKKDVVISGTASWVYRAAPYITFVAALLAAMFFPLTAVLGSIAFHGDILLAVYLLALGRFFMALAALDTGSTFGGMGSSREVMIAALIEPSLLISLITLGLIGGSTSVHDIMSINSLGSILILNPYSLLLFAAIFIILIAETARIPVDDPSTHLELTMIHEAMLLEYSGKYLALLEMAAAIKQLIFITILVNFFFPLENYTTASGPVLAFCLGLLLYIIKIVIISISVALVEIFTVKLRFFSVPNLAAISFALAFVGFMQFFVIGR